MIKREIEYVPKGGMCRGCKDKNKDCSAYDFSSMRKISKGDVDGVVIVKCEEYKPSSST